MEKEPEIPQFIKDMAEVEFGEGGFAEWYNNGGMQGD